MRGSYCPTLSTVIAVGIVLLSTTVSGWSLHAGFVNLSDKHVNNMGMS